jgi:hypothetical protein
MTAMRAPGASGITGAPAGAAAAAAEKLRAQGLGNAEPRMRVAPAAAAAIPADIARRAGAAPAFPQRTKIAERMLSSWAQRDA